MVCVRQKNSFAKKQLKMAPGILFFLGAFLFLFFPLSIDAAGDPPHNDSSGGYLYQLPWSVSYSG